MFVSNRKQYTKWYLSLTAAAILLQTHNVYSETTPRCTGTLTFNGLTTCGTDNYIDANSIDAKRKYIQCATSADCTLSGSAPTCTGRKLTRRPQGFSDSTSYPICSDHFVGNYTCTVLGNHCFQLTNGEKGCVGTYCIPPSTEDNSSDTGSSSSSSGNSSNGESPFGGGSTSGSASSSGSTDNSSGSGQSSSKGSTSGAESFSGSSGDSSSGSSSTSGSSRSKSSSSGSKSGSSRKVGHR